MKIIVDYAVKVFATHVQEKQLMKVKYVIFVLWKISWEILHSELKR